MTVFVAWSDFSVFGCVHDLIQAIVLTLLHETYIWRMDKNICLRNDPPNTFWPALKYSSNLQILATQKFREHITLWKKLYR